MKFSAAKLKELKDAMTHKTAVLSDDGLYRYRLTREWGPGVGTIYGFVGVNPSTADADQEDATTRKWRGFVERWDGDGYEVANLYAFRATNPKDLAAAADPRGPGNLSHIHAMAKRCDVLVPCWGNLQKVPRAIRSRTYARSVIKLLQATGKPVKHLGLTTAGDPKHPLMLSYSTELEDF